MEDLDIQWFEEQEQIEKTYDKYYNKPVDYVWVTLLYIKDNQIEYIKKEKVVLQNGTFTKRNLVKYIHKNKKQNDILYSLHAISMFNMTITPDQIIGFDYTDNYFKSIPHMEDIVYQDTISYLSSVNELFILLTPKQTRHSTQKIHLSTRNKTRRSVY